MISEREVGNSKSSGKTAHKGSKIVPVIQAESKFVAGMDPGREMLFQTPFGSPKVTSAITLSRAGEEIRVRVLWATRAP